MTGAEPGGGAGGGAAGSGAGTAGGAAGAGRGTGGGAGGGLGGGVAGALLVVGDVVTDIVARHSDPPAPRTDTAARIAVRPGGAGANAAAWAARAGAAVRLLGRVGADAADWHRRELAASGVRSFLTVDRATATAVVIALVDATAERSFLTDSGATANLGPADWDPSLLDGAGRVHLSGYLCFTEPGRELAATVIREAARRGVPVSVDPASAGFIAGLGRDRFLAAVVGAGLLLPNLDEARLLSGEQEPEAAAVALARRFGEAVVKLGGDGAVVAVGDRIAARVPARPVEPLDTTGAGDAFTGTYLAARLTGASPADAATAACEAGALAVRTIGGRPPTGPVAT
ncbi:carbohydrate kinase family protein [Kitasatospora sp. NPDC048365]|uniref:carbohydrate kinase family protein n=1 Tax=Kitasatospora sp. NPDC048365 TaxID=3364050 RepID=UPI00371018A3